jgi:hypothetical protein
MVTSQISDMETSRQSGSSTLRRFARARLKPLLRTMHTTNYFSDDFHSASREIKQERRSI